MPQPTYVPMSNDLLAAFNMSQQPVNPHVSSNTFDAMDAQLIAAQQQQQQNQLPIATPMQQQLPDAVPMGEAQQLPDAVEMQKPFVEGGFGVMAQTPAYGGGSMAQSGINQQYLNQYQVSDPEQEAAKMVTSGSGQMKQKMPAVEKMQQTINGMQPLGFSPNARDLKSLGQNYDSLPPPPSQSQGAQVQITQGQMARPQPKWMNTGKSTSKKQAQPLPEVNPKKSGYQGQAPEKDKNGDYHYASLSDFLNYTFTKEADRPKAVAGDGKRFRTLGGKK